jgi:hypothetical protein
MTRKKLAARNGNNSIAVIPLTANTRKQPPRNKKKSTNKTLI